MLANCTVLGTFNFLSSFFFISVKRIHTQKIKRYFSRHSLIFFVFSFSFIFSRNLNEIQQIVYKSFDKQFTNPSIMKENAVPEVEAASATATSIGAANASSTTVSLPSRPLSHYSGPISHSHVVSRRLCESIMP